MLPENLQGKDSVSAHLSLVHKLAQCGDSDSQSTGGLSPTRAQSAVKASPLSVNATLTLAVCCPGSRVTSGVLPPSTMVPSTGGRAD